MLLGRSPKEEFTPKRPWPQPGISDLEAWDNVNAPSVSDYSVTWAGLPRSSHLWIKPPKRTRILSPETDEFLTGNGICHLRAPEFRRDCCRFKGRAAHNSFKPTKKADQCSQKTRAGLVAT